MSLLEIVVSAIVGILPSFVCLLILTKLVGHHVGFSLLWGNLKKQYTTTQVKLQMATLNSFLYILFFASLVLLVVTCIALAASKDTNGDSLGSLCVVLFLSCCASMSVGHVVEDTFKNVSDESSAVLHPVDPSPPT